MTKLNLTLINSATNLIIQRILNMSEGEKIELDIKSILNSIGYNYLDNGQEYYSVILPIRNAVIAECDIRNIGVSILSSLTQRNIEVHRKTEVFTKI
ncbi:MAG: hypothetical protein ACRCTZ_17075 [Sarcina sp.]